MFSLWLIFMDPPEHTRLRKLLNKGFSPPAIEALRPQVENLVDRMLEPLKPGMEIDLLSSFAYPMPVSVISEMMGVPKALHGTFAEWSRAIAVFRGSPNRTVEHARAAQQAMLHFTDYFRKTVAERKRNKGTDLIKTWGSFSCLMPSLAVYSKARGWPRLASLWTQKMIRRSASISTLSSYPCLPFRTVCSCR
jgi:cytochrome P450